MTTVSTPQTEINSVIELYSNGQIQEVLDDRMFMGNLQ